MIETIPIKFSAIKYFLDMLRSKPEYNTLAVGKCFDNNNLFAIALVDDTKITGFYSYPKCCLKFWRRWSMRKEFIYVLDVKTDINLDPNDFFSDPYPLTVEEQRVYKKYGYYVIVKTRFRKYNISGKFKLNDT